MPPSLRNYIDGLMKQAKYEAGFVAVDRILALADKLGDKLPEDVAALVADVKKARPA
jgi:hypothetical protein